MIYPQETGYGSVFEDASHYFSLTPSLEQHIEDLKAQLKKIEGNKNKEVLAEQLTKQITNSTEKLEEERLARIERLDAVSTKIIELCEGDNWQETQQLSAKLLGTLMLLTRGPEGNFARVHMRFKPLYKAVLTLRLVDRLLEHDTIAHKYLSKYREAASRFRGNRYWRDKWKTELGRPAAGQKVRAVTSLSNDSPLSLI